MAGKKDDPIVLHMDERIAELEKKIARVDPLIAELSDLRKARALITGEAMPTRNHDLGTRVQAELKAHGPSRPQNIAEALGDVTASTMRSHLHMGKLNGVYVRNEDGTWQNA